jgi:hypothetical protein
VLCYEAFVGWLGAGAEVGAIVGRIATAGFDDLRVEDAPAAPVR